MRRTNKYNRYCVPCVKLIKCSLLLFFFVFFFFFIFDLLLLLVLNLFLYYNLIDFNLNKLVRSESIVHWLYILHEIVYI